MTPLLISIEFFCPVCGQVYHEEFLPAQARIVLANIDDLGDNCRICTPCAERLIEGSP